MFLALVLVLHTGEDELIKTRMQLALVLVLHTGENELIKTRMQPSDQIHPQPPQFCNIPTPAIFRND